MKTEEKKRRFLKALRDARGIIVTACEATGTSRAAYYKWLSEDPTFKEEAETIEAGQIDKVESKLLDKIEEGDTTAIIYYLKAKGRKRGWNEKSTDLADEGPAPVYGPQPPAEWARKAFEIQVEKLEAMRKEYEERTGKHLFFPGEPEPISVHWHATREDKERAIEIMERKIKGLRESIDNPDEEYIRQ